MNRWIFLCALLGSSVGVAQDHVTLTYQGQLNNADGQQVSAAHTMTFSLYSQAEGGDPLWVEIHGAVNVVDGIFTVNMGTQEPLTSGLSSEPLLFLGIAIADNDEMTPRVRVGGALQAQWAKVADHARDVLNEDIHPRSVSIGETEVINAQGQWVGAPTGLVGPPGAEGPAGPAPDLSLDTDTDGVVDWMELAMGYNPLDGADTPMDEDADGMPDILNGVDGTDGLQGVRGEQGLQGVPGVQGPATAHQWSGTRIRFQNPDGAWGEYVDLVGAQGIQGVQGAVGPAGNTVNLRLDSDTDGFADWIEIALSTDPNDGGSKPADSNLNGIADAFEANVNSGAPGMPTGDTLYANYTVTNLAELSAIEQYRFIEGTLTVSTNDLTRVRLPNLESVGALSIQGNGQVTQLEMPNLANVDGDLTISANGSLGSVVLPSLATIGQSLSIVAHANLTELRMPQLTSIGNQFELAANGGLPSLADGFPSLSTVGNRFNLAANGGLSTLGNSFSALTSVGDDFILEGNGNLTSLDTSFANLATVGGEFRFGANSSLTHLGSAFAVLSSISGPFDFNENSNLETLGDGFGSLTSVGGSYAFHNNTRLASLGAGFAQLTSVGGFFRINGNHSLTTFGDGYSALESVGSYLAVFSHNTLKTIRMPSLQTVGGHMTIGGGDRAFYENDVLENIAFPALTSIVGGQDGACRRDTTQSPGGCNPSGSNSLQIYRNPLLPKCLRDYYEDVTNVARVNGGSYVADGRDDCQCALVDDQFQATCPNP